MTEKKEKPNLAPKNDFNQQTACKTHLLVEIDNISVSWKNKYTQRKCKQITDKTANN